MINRNAKKKSKKQYCWHFSKKENSKQQVSLLHLYQNAYEGWCCQFCFFSKFFSFPSKCPENRGDLLGANASVRFHSISDWYLGTVFLKWRTTEKNVAWNNVRCAAENLPSKNRLLAFVAHTMIFCVAWLLLPTMFLEYCLQNERKSPCSIYCSSARVPCTLLGTHVPFWVHLPVWRGTFKIIKGREKICLYIIYFQIFIHITLRHKSAIYNHTSENLEVLLKTQ